MKRKIFIIFVLTLALILLINGCGRQSDTDNTVSSINTRVADETTSSVEYTRTPVTRGYTAVLMGFSSFQPYYSEIEKHAHNAGILDHEQITFFQGGPGGIPIELWNNPEMSPDIKNALDTNDVTLFGMVYQVRELYPSLEGYENWINYALQSNPNISIFIGMFWPGYPSSYDAAEWEAVYESYHAGAHQTIDDLRKEYPGTNIYCIPYGQAAIELKKMWEAGELSEIPRQIGDGKTGAGETSIFMDEIGHPCRMLVDLGSLIWLNAIYGVDLINYDYDFGYSIDLKAIATEIMNNHDHKYDSR